MTVADRFSQTAVLLSSSCSLLSSPPPAHSSPYNLPSTAMGFSSLYSPNYMSSSCSPPSSQYSVSSFETGSTSPRPNSNSNNHWDLPADYPGLCHKRSSTSLGSSHSNLVPVSHPLFNTTNITNPTHIPILGRVALSPPPPPHPPPLVARSGPRKSALGYSPPSQPSEPIDFFKRPADAIAPATLARLLDERPLNVLLFDIRSDRAYETGHIYQAINVPIPMKKLRKTSFTLDKMIADFVLDQDLEKVTRWNQVGHIVVYDNDRDGQSGTAGSAAFYLLEKFIQAGWKGQNYVLRGEYISIYYTDDPPKLTLVSQAGSRALLKIIPERSRRPPTLKTALTRVWIVSPVDQVEVYLREILVTIPRGHWSTLTGIIF